MSEDPVKASSKTIRLCKGISNLFFLESQHSYSALLSLAGTSQSMVNQMSQFLPSLISGTPVRMALLPTHHRLTHPHSLTVCVLPLSSPFGTFSVYISTGSLSSLSSKRSLDGIFSLKVQPVDVSITPLQPRPWQVGFNNFFNRQQGGGFDHLPKMSRCLGGHIFILHPSLRYMSQMKTTFSLFSRQKKRLI